MVRWLTPEQQSLKVVRLGHAGKDKGVGKARKWLET